MRSYILAAMLLSELCLCHSATLFAADETAPAEAGAKRPFGQFFTIGASIDDVAVSALRTTVLDLQSKASREDREAILVLEVQPGEARFGTVTDISKFLTSAEAGRVRTVAWIPQTVDGSRAVLALACHDIMMAADARLGDIGRGVVLDEVEQNFVRSIVDRRRNSRVSRGVVEAMMNPAVTLLRVSIEAEDGAKGQRFVTDDELRVLREKNTVILETSTIKEPGAAGLFHASDSEKSGFLVAKILKSRTEVASAVNLPLEALREKESDTKEPSVRVIAVHGVIDRMLGSFVHREVRNAVADKVDIVLLDIDSPGGDKDVSESLAETLSELDNTKITTVAWIPKGAWSGGALIALSCDRIIMTPDAQIGDVGVIALTAPGGQFERAPEKIVSPFLQFAETLARRKNRPPALLQAMIDKDLEVFQVTNKKDGRVSYMSDVEIQASNEEWVKGPLVPESRAGVLLTVRGERAHELGLADAPCRDFGELRTRLGISDRTDMKPVKSTWVDRLVMVLNSGFGGFALITLGIIFIYIELHLVSGLFAILATLSFSLFFWSRFLGGTAGTLELVLFALGLGLLALEIFVIPGFGVFGVSGILLTLASLIMASHTFSGMTTSEKFNESMGSLGQLAGALVTVIGVAAVINRFLPTMPFVKRLILTPPGYAAAGNSGPFLNPSLLEESHLDGPVPIGAKGIAASALKPSGKGIFGDKYLDVVSDGAFIDHGTPIEVIRIAGNRIIVRVASANEPPSADSNVFLA
jgi:membrane-bound serine protease (ClpP class)